MNKFGVLESEIFGPILSFNYVAIIENYNISIGFFYTDNPIDHLIVYNNVFISDDIDIKDAPTKMVRLSLMEKKILDIYADDSYPEKWILNDNEKDIIFKTIRDEWENIIRDLKHFQNKNILEYPEHSPY